MRLLFAAATAALVSTTVQADQRDWRPGDFDRVASEGSYDVHIVPGPTASVRADGPRERLERMDVRVERGRLVIGTRRGFRVGWMDGGGRVRVEVVAPGRLREAEMAGSGTMTLERVDAPRFAASVSGSGDIVLRAVRAGDLTASVAGSGSVRAAGMADRARAEIAGSGDMRLGELRVTDFQGSVSGSGNIDAFATRTAALNLVGSGDARVRGGARCTVARAGSGRATCST